MDTASWKGYEFKIYRHGANWLENAGLYVFAGSHLDRQGTSRWQIYYVGKTTDFSARIPTHEKWPEAQRLGATHVHARVEQEEWRRDLIEDELIHAFQPPLNDLLK